MKKLDEITIADLMPDSISGDREVSVTARAIDPQLKVISEGVDLPLILASIDTLSAGVLEHLAAQYDLTAWDSAWPIDTKRAVLKTAIADKRKKGTRGAVQRAIEAVAPLATITEWWQKTPQGTPHTFEIDVLQDGEAVDAETVADVIAQVNDSKPVRSHFTFSVGQKAEGNMYLSGVIRTIAYARVRSSGMTAVQTEIDAGVLAALRGMNIRRIMEFSHMGDMPEPTPVVPSIPMGGVLTSTSDSVIRVPVEQADGSVSVGGYAYSDGALLDMSWNFGGVVEEYSPAPVIITLYMAPNSHRSVQPSVINTSSPSSSYCYQMYTSETVQDDSTKFIPDPTKNYIYGYYSSQTGEWVDSSAKYNVSQMPDSTGGDKVELRQVLENGKLWLGTNKTSYWYTALNTVSFRVVDKP